MIKIDQDKCIGCGACVGMCPEVFELKDGKAHVKSPDAGNTCDCESVKNMCPGSAISL